MRKYFFVLMVCLSILSFVGCGTTNSLERKYAVPHAIITVSDSLQVTGAIVYENDSTISIVAFGAPITYEKLKVKKIDRKLLPNPDKIQKDILLNTESTATNTGLVFATMFVSIVSAIFLLVSNK